MLQSACRVSYDDSNGIFTYDDYEYSSGYNTDIYKFDISRTGNVSYNTKNKIEGKTINQYSLDEQNGHLRVALYDNNGARVAIFDENFSKNYVEYYLGVKYYDNKNLISYINNFISFKMPTGYCLLSISLYFVPQH